MWCKAILVLFFVAQLSGVQSAVCTFQNTGTIFRVYMCTLVNQNIQQDAGVVVGEHVPGFTDANVTALRQTGSTITVFPSYIINQFVNMQSVALHNAGMTSFGNPITNCARLDHLFLNNGGITSIPGRFFQNCGNLVQLSIQNHPVHDIHIDAFVGLSSLEYLWIGGANIQTLNPLVLLPMTRLGFLELPNSRITTISTQFPFLPHLRLLRLTNNNFTVWNPTILGMTSQLRSLYLDRNEISVLTADAFANLPELTFLTVGDGLTVLPVFQNLGRLQQLSIERCPIQHVSAASFQNMGSLRVLTLNGNQIATIDFTARTPAILQGLTSLYLANNQIANIQDFAFGTLTALRWLDLRNNQITRLNESSIQPIIPNMITLDLRNNDIQYIERGLFNGVISLTVRMSGCHNGNVFLGENLQSSSQAFINNCMSFGLNLKANVSVLLIMLGIAVLGRK